MVAMTFMNLNALSLKGVYSLGKSDVQWGCGRILFKDWQILVWVPEMERVCGGIH